jgi:mono/diheme cytochrome c family protein
MASWLAAAGCSEEPDRPIAAQPAGERPAPAKAPPAPPPAPAGPAAGPRELAEASASELELEPERTDWTGGDAAEGQKLYTVYCLACHGAEGRGDGPSAPMLNPKPRDFSSGVYYIDANANAQTGEATDLARVIREGPGAFGGSTAMPAWKGTFDVQQLRHLIAYLKSLSERDDRG